MPRTFWVQKINNDRSRKDGGYGVARLSTPAAGLAGAEVELIALTSRERKNRESLGREKGITGLRCHCKTLTSWLDAYCVCN